MTARKVGSPPASREAATDLAAISSGRRLLEAQERVGLPQEILAERAALHRTTISLLERGLREPRIAQIVKLAGSLEVDVAVLTNEHNFNARVSSDPC